MATGPEHYRMAQLALDKATSGFYSEDQQITWALAEAQVRATLALAEATAGRLAPLVWQLDDGGENTEPDLYATRGAAMDSAFEGYKRDNPFTYATIADTEWRRVKDEDDASQLVVKRRETGIVVRGIRLKGRG